MSNCRVCATQKTQLVTTEDEVRRIARQMARTDRPARLSTLKDHLAIAKVQREESRELIERGHECDNKLSDEHWTKGRA